MKSQAKVENSGDIEDDFADLIVNKSNSLAGRNERDESPDAMKQS